MVANPVCGRLDRQWRKRRRIDTRLRYSWARGKKVLDWDTHGRVIAENTAHGKGPKLSCPGTLLWGNVAGCLLAAIRAIVPRTFSSSLGLFVSTCLFSLRPPSFWGLTSASLAPQSLHPSPTHLISSPKGISSKGAWDAYSPQSTPPSLPPWRNVARYGFAAVGLFQNAPC
jgi:hypothetical protein